jgi:hypothetical protein
MGEKSISFMLADNHFHPSLIFAKICLEQENLFSRPQILDKDGKVWD